MALVSISNGQRPKAKLDYIYIYIRFGTSIHSKTHHNQLRQNSVCWSFTIIISDDHHVMVPARSYSLITFHYSFVLLLAQVHSLSAKSFLIFSHLTKLNY